jgi:HTH-type transcriptional regulator/antitoxin HipB
MSYTVHTPQQLGSVLHGQRKARKLTQKQVGEAVDLLPKTISNLENKPKTVSIESLFKLLSALELEIVIRSRRQESATSDW